MIRRTSTLHSIALPAVTIVTFLVGASISLLTFIQTNPYVSPFFANISIIISSSTPIILAIMAYLQHRQGVESKQRGAAAIEATKQVETAVVITGEATKAAVVDTGAVTAGSLTEIKTTADKTLAHVNSQKGAILSNLSIVARQYWVLAKKAANETPTPESTAEADAAEKVSKQADKDLAEHVVEQAKVDSEAK